MRNLALSLLLLAQACAYREPDPCTPEGIKILEHSPADIGSNRGEDICVVARTEDDWTELVKHVSSLSFAKLDTSQNMAIAILLSQRSHSGYSVEISEIRRDPLTGGYVVTYREVISGSNFPTVTSPPPVVRVLPRTDCAVKFVRLPNRNESEQND